MVKMISTSKRRRAIFASFWMVVVSTSTASAFSTGAFARPSRIQPLSVSATSARTDTVALEPASVEKQTFLIDGAERQSLQQDRAVIATGNRLDTGERVVGMLSEDSSSSSSSLLLPDSVAAVPTSVSPSDARCTYRASLVAVRGAWPALTDVAGSTDAVLPETFRSVVLGSSDMAVFAARALAALGGDVHVVTSSSTRKVEKGIGDTKNLAGKVTVIKPGMGVNETGFAAFLGEFDSLVDTLHDERSSGPSSTSSSSSYSYADEDEDEDEDFSYSPPESSVTDLLASRHQCHRYVSTLTESQRMVGDEGVVFGPGKTNEYASKVGKSGSESSSILVPPVRMGHLVESVMEAGVILSTQTWKKMEHPKSPKDANVRGWSLADFWEQTTWPRDSSSSSPVRYGLPTRSEFSFDEEEEETLIAAPPLRRGGIRDAMTSRYAKNIEIGSIETADEREAMEAERARLLQKADTNPFVMDVVGVRGLRERIVGDKLDCVLFLSARFCKTCKTLNPQYTRMARIQDEEHEGDPPVVFAKGEASGRLGRQLGQELGVLAVPSFLLFRQGRRFGPPISLSRLPSKKLDRALELLQSGATEWDNSVFDSLDLDDGEDDKDRRSRTML